MGLVQRILGWWSPPPPPPTPAGVYLASNHVASRCVPITVLSTLPAALNPVDTAADLQALFSAFCAALAIIGCAFWIRQRLASLYSTRPLTAIIGLALIAFAICGFSYDHLGLHLLPIERGAIFSTISNDWAHTWPAGITAKSNINRCYHDLSTLLLRYIPHQTKASLWDEIHTTISWLALQVAGLKSGGLLIADIPVIAALLCFSSAFICSIYPALNMAPTQLSQTRASFTEEDIAAARLPESLQTHISRHRLFVKRLSRNRRNRLNVVDAEQTQLLEKNTILKGLLQGKTATEIRQSVCDYDRVSGDLKLLQGQAKEMVKVNEEFKELNDRVHASNEELGSCNKKLSDKNTLLETEKAIWLAANQDTLNTDSGIEAFKMEVQELTKNLRTRNDELEASNKTLTDANSNLLTHTGRLLESTGSNKELSKAVHEENGKLRKEIEQLRELNSRLVTTVKGLRTGNTSTTTGNGSEPGSVPSDVASPDSGTGAEAGASPDNGTGSVDGGLNKPEANDGEAGPSTGQAQNTDAGDDNDPSPDGESSTGPLNDDTPGSNAGKKKRKPKRGGKAVRAAKAAAYAKAMEEGG